MEEHRERYCGKMASFLPHKKVSTYLAFAFGVSTKDIAFGRTYGECQTQRRYVEASGNYVRFVLGGGIESE